MQMLTFRPIAVDEMGAFQEVQGQGFGYVPNPEDVAHWQATLDFSRTLAAFEDDELIGTSAALPLGTTVPGGALVPTAGITMVAVSPGHRRKGVLTEMMRLLLEAAHERGEPLASLWASESLIYPRFGYGLAIEDDHWEIERPFGRFARDQASSGAVRMVDEVFARLNFPQVWERALPSRPGMTRRDEKLWNDRFRDAGWSRGAGSPLFFAAYVDGGRVDGYVLYRVRQDWPDGVPGNEVIVVEEVAATDEAHAALWRFLLDIDLSRQVSAQHRPLDDALPLMLADVRRLKRRRRDAIWLRLVDLAAALEARRYGIEGALVLDVRDDLCRWNPARVRLDGGPHGARCTPSDAGPDLVLTTTDLAATYLGGTRLSALARAGRVEEHTPGALARADAMFDGGRAPWCPQFF
ncbi:MAG: GNAT family N-acetyltransferase [Dehalococcoidia bacterium]